MPQFVIGSGYFEHFSHHPGIDGKGRILPQHFATLWFKCIRRSCELTRRPIVVSIGKSGNPWWYLYDKLKPQVLELSGNPGHITDLIAENSTKGPYTGWTLTMVALCSIAALEECDLVFVEQDCLVFGRWLDVLYDEAENAGCLYGYHPTLGAACSLLLIRKWFLTDFIVQFLSLPSQNNAGWCGESRFCTLKNIYSQSYKQMQMGYDRIRPFNPSDESFYIQQVNQEDVDILKLHNRL